MSRTATPDPDPPKQAAETEGAADPAETQAGAAEPPVASSWKARGEGGPALEGAFPAVAAALSTLPFLPALAGPWLFDDVRLIAENPSVHDFLFGYRWLTSHFWDTGEGDSMPGLRYWRPLVQASYTADWLLSGGNPLWFHLVNIGLHAAVVALATAALLRWTRNAPLALLGALAFAVHPTRAESVAWIAGRPDLWCALLLLAAALGFSARLARRWWGLPVEVLAGLLAFTAKEQAVVLPALLAVEVWAAHAAYPELRRNPLLRRLAVCVGPWCAVVSAYLAARVAWMPFTESAASQLPLAVWALQFLESLGRYVALSVAPWGLSVQHGLLCAERPVPWSLVALGACAFAFGAALVPWAWRRAPAVAVGLLLAGATLLPVSNLIPIPTKTLVSERFLYVPHLGGALVLATLLAPLLRRATLRWAAAVAAVLALAAGTAWRSAAFADPSTFWEQELRTEPHSFVALKELARVARGERRLMAALELEQRAHAAEVSCFPGSGGGTRVALVGVESALRLVPDAQVDELQSIGRFATELLANRPAALRLHTVPLEVTLDPRRWDPSERRRHALSLLSLRADVASRLGDDVQAAADARALGQGCVDCSALPAAALALARAGRYDEASALNERSARRFPAAVQQIRALLALARRSAREAKTASGPAALVARAQELEILRAYGRAYAVLAPHRAEIVESPLARPFAQLAFRAGHARVASEVLALELPPAAVLSTLEQWRSDAGWR